MATETKLRQLAEQGCAVYYFYSSERYLVRRAVAAASQLLAAGEDEETTVLDGATPGIEQLIMAAGTISFFGTRRVVVLPEIDPSAYSDKDLDELCETLGSLENAVVVLGTVFDLERNKLKLGKRAQKLINQCKKLGFTGFDDFKQNFVRELEYLDQQQGKVDFNFPFAENDSPMRVAQNIGELYEEAVKDTMQLLRYEDLHKAVLLLKYHEEIHIFSAGTAINQAESFREKMLKIGKRVVIFNNLNYQRYQACCLSERDLAMIISYSGETAQMLEIARQCKRSGTPILALTSFGENSLTCYADCKLTLSTKESIYQNLGDYASHLSMTLLLDILYSEYFRQNYQKNYTYKLERARELEQHRTSTNPILLNLHKENAE